MAYSLPIPSVNTGVCSRQTRRFNESAAVLAALKEFACVSDG
jgi:peroxiredoxin